jgi:drug/metabolite transporter (DMT)-like permease
MRFLVLAAGVCACSTAGVMIKASRTDPLLVAAYRLLLACALLLPAFLRARRRHPEHGLGALARAAVPAALLLAAHFWSWNLSVRMTAVANASLIVNLVAVAMPFVIWVMARERLTARELGGTALALAGTAVLAAADYRLDLRHFAGDLLCFGSMLTFTVYLAWNRRCVHVPTIWLYVPVVYGLAGVVCLALGGWRAGGVLVTDPREAWLMLGLAVVPTIAGHTILNASMRVLRSQVVAVLNLGQFIPAGILAWWCFGEVPGAAFAAAVALVIGGALVVITGSAAAASRR